MVRSRLQPVGSAATLALLVVAGCASPALSVSVEQARTIQDDLRQRAAQRFDNAAYYKPRDSGMGAPIEALAPLLVQQLPADMKTDEVLRLQFGGVLEDRNGVITIDPTLPTLYVRHQPADQASAARAWVVFIWAYPAPEPAAGVVVRGLKMTLDSDGYPVVYEPLRGQTDSKHGPLANQSIFVDATVESIAAAEFGPPLPGRRFSIEPSIKQAPDTFVVGLLDRGPIPMGPYAYLDYPRSAVTTILCRCSPSQVDQFQVEQWYDLRDLGELEGLGIALVDAFLHARRGRTDSAARGSSASDITRQLRWPGKPDAPIRAPGASLVTPPPHGFAG